MNENQINQSDQYWQVNTKEKKCSSNEFDSIKYQFQFLASIAKVQGLEFKLDEDSILSIEKSHIRNSYITNNCDYESEDNGYNGDDEIQRKIRPARKQK